MSNKRNAYLNAETPANTGPKPNLDPRPPKPDSVVLQGPNGPVIMPMVALGHVPAPMAQWMHQLIVGAVKAALAETFATALGLVMFPQAQAGAMARDANRLVALRAKLLDGNADVAAIAQELQLEFVAEKKAADDAAAAAQAKLDEANKAAAAEKK